MPNVTGLEREIRSDGLTPERMEASLRLEFERDETRGCTVLAASWQEPPLRIVRAFPLADGAALAHLHNVSGGLLGGDQLALKVRVGSGAHVQLTTTGATRIYHRREDSVATSQANEIAVGENGLLEYVPDSIIPFAGARYRQRTTIDLAEGAGLFWWEVLAPGREARGEVFEYECVEMRTDLTARGRPIAAERVRLEPRSRALEALARLGPYRTWATFYVCRVGVEASAWAALENELREVARGWTGADEARWGFSTLEAHGLVVRGVARHGRDALHGLQAIWAAAKLRLYHREAVPPRKLN